MVKTVHGKRCETLDSNTVIQYVKGHHGVVAKVKAEVEIAVPAIVVYEIEVGTT